jgi:hypothetical protein
MQGPHSNLFSLPGMVRCISFGARHQRNYYIAIFAIISSLICVEDGKNDIVHDLL